MLEGKDNNVLEVMVILGLALIVKRAAAADAVVFITRFGTVEFLQSGAREGCESSESIETVTEPVGRATPL
jgi:hypothetical protein